MSIFFILNHPCFFMVYYYYLFGIFYLCKVSFSGFLQFKGNFDGDQNDTKCHGCDPLRQCKKQNARGGVVS